MLGLFNENNFLHVALMKIWDIVLANLLFILCCIPIITIGPSFTALYHCTLRMVKGNNSGTLKTFFRAFRQNFRQSFAVWLITIVFVFILSNNFLFLKEQSNTAAHILLYVMTIFVFLLCMMCLYIYPVIAAFEGTLKMHLRNAFLFSVRHFFKTLLMLIIWALPLASTYFDIQLQPLYVFCWFFFLFSTLAYLCSVMLYKMFKPYLPSDPEINDEERYSETDNSAYLS